MFKRPGPGEDEEDILRMQEEFLKEKKNNQNLQPAAYVTNLHQNESTKRPKADQPGIRKPSKYAKSKGLKTHEGNRTDVASSSLVGDIFEKNMDKTIEIDEDDQVYFPTIKPSLLGKIVEKNIDNNEDLDFKPMPIEGFPTATKRDINQSLKPKSISLQENVMEVDEPTHSETEEYFLRKKNNLPSKSYILSSGDSNDIHNENIQLLSEMSEQDILEEQQKLLSSLDPSFVAFLKSKRQQNQASPTALETPQRKENFDDKSAEILSQNTTTDDTLWENDVLSHPEVNKWLHFNSLETDKLQWMKGIEESKKVKPKEPYEARFDFKGYLLPYTMEYTEQTKTLFHHGEESHRPGYSITELIELSRSAITQQRVMALNTIAGVLEYYSVGTYKNILDIPISKLFFIIRIAMDENKVIILEPALKAMRNLLYNRVDEASLDALIGFEEGTMQPCLENDKSEIEELESKESEFNDFHLAEIDIISALQRTEILQRLYYIFETIKPTFNCVQYSLQILIRLSRDSVETANKIVQTEHLMNSIIKNFMPSTGVNFVFDPQTAYKGKPVLAALKLMRILSLQHPEICSSLITKYDILKPVKEYISSSVDRTYGLRIQIEAFCLLSNFLHFGLGTDVAMSLSPVIANTLYKHVQGTNVSVECSILSATHAAVVIQVVNKIISSKIYTEKFKVQVYPLLKEGVQKWIGQISHANSYTCGHLRVLCSILDCCKTIILIEHLPIKILNDALVQLSTSPGFKALVKKLIPSSNLLSGLDKSDLHLSKNLMSLGSSVIDSSHKVLPILNVVSPLPFLASLCKLLTYVNDRTLSQIYLKHFSAYLIKISKKLPSLCDNWFTRMESEFLFNLTRLAIQVDNSEASKDVLYSVANKLCYILRTDKRYELEFIFNSIVFNKDWFTAERLLNLVNLTDADGYSKALTSITDIRLCYNKVINLTYRDTGPNILLRKWQEPILPRDWIYLPILMLYSKSQEAGPNIYGEHAKRVAEHVAKEKEFIIRCSLEWILFNELCFPDFLNDIDPTDKLCRIMCVFLCDSSLFLDPKINMLLQKCVQILFRSKSQFDFDRDLAGLHNFQDFYTQFLEQFQSVSYGDNTFAAIVLVPLAQRHNVKWRKLLWSEYAGCLRALDCPEHELCYDINEYLQPDETDESLVKSYFRALSNNSLRPATIAYRIATHHTNQFKNRQNCIDK